MLWFNPFSVTDGGTVLDENGRKLTVAFPQIDMPENIWWNGRWIDRMIHPGGEKSYLWPASSIERHALGL